MTHCAGASRWTRAEGMYVDPMRDVVGVYYSTTPQTGDADILMGYIRQVAKDLAGK